MIELIQRTRDTLISSPDTVCPERARLATEAWRLFVDESVPIRRAKTFAYILEHMTLDLESYPVFAGNTSSRPRAWMLLPEYGFGVPDQAVVENPSFKGFLDDAVPQDIREYWEGKSFGGAGIGHLAVNLGRVLSDGLEGIIAEAENLELTDYRRAMIIACKAVIAWAKRYAGEARRTAESQADPSVRDALLRVANACECVPAKPAVSLFEALQAIVLVHMAVAIEGHAYSVSLGLLDRVLHPYRYDDEDATELISAFLLKIASNSIWGSHSKTQAITIGGANADGNDACNPLTMHILDACNAVRMPDPHVFLRWHRKMDQGVKERALELLASGLSMPLLVGDEQTVEGFISAGLPAEDAWRYCVIGCNELGIPGKLWDSATGPCMVDPAVLNDALKDSVADSIEAVPDMMGAVRKTMKQHISRALSGARNHWERLAERVPTPFTSALMDGCVVQGRDFHTGSQYSRPVLMERGFTTAVNGLAAVEKVVFEDKAVTLGELAEALDNNFDGKYAVVRQMLVNAPKWGNDDDRADKWAAAWMEMREGALHEVEAELGDKRRVVQHVIRSLHHIDGAKLGATPDGRLAGTPTADSIGPVAGTALKGPTALLNSVRKLQPSRYWQGGYNLNLTLSSDSGMRANLLALVEAFFAEGGQELQIGCLDAEMLKDAKAHPEIYPQLLVRIAGFNALFTRLSTAEQDELIARAESGF